MSDFNWQQVETILDQALDLPEEERQSFVNKTCRDNPVLKGEVTQLLESIFDSDGWLEDPPGYKEEFYKEVSEDVELLSPDRSLIGKKVGAYSIKKQIGKGGMGSVYLAERSDEGFNHQVAIKIISHGRATRTNIRRFKREQQILADLNHPGIAQLFDGGVTNDGFPYIIMEYVDGIPIDEYCKQHECTIPEKINLFKQVLQAVRHAHENLVIHRDLKPGNILVDQSGQIKILDFGISKFLEEDEAHSLTRTGSHLLTPKYAAPEQIKGTNITTSTDLYALGIIFYELLSGTPPFDPDRDSRYEVEKSILEKEPSHPSTTVDSKQLQKQLAGDLDAIALKAIRKEPDRRYRVANDFLNDLELYEKGLPVTAQEDSLKYRSMKFFKRHRQGVTVVAGILLLIIGFTGFYTWRITEERNQAQLEAQRAEAATSFLRNLFKSNDPSVSEGKDLSASELLERGRQRIEELDNAEIRTSMFIVIGEAYSDLGFYHEAENVLDQAINEIKNIFGEYSLKMYDALSTRGDIEAAGHNYDLALPYHRESYHIISSKANTNDPRLVEALQNFGESLRFVGKLDSAEMMIQKALTVQQKHHPDDTANLTEIKGIYALILRKQDEHGAAAELYLDIIDQVKQDSGSKSLQLATYHNNLSFTYIDREEYQKAEKYLRKSLRINEEIRGPGHPTTLMVRSNIIGVLQEQEKVEEAIELLYESIRYTKEKFTENHWQTAKKYGYLGYILTQKGDLEKGEKYLRKSALTYEKTLGARHKWTAIAWSKVAANLYFQQQDNPANSLFKKHFNVLKNKTTELRPVNKSQIKDLITLYQDQEKDFSGIIGQYQKLVNETAN